MFTNYMRRHEGDPATDPLLLGEPVSPTQIFPVDPTGHHTLSMDRRPTLVHDASFQPLYPQVDPSSDWIPTSFKPCRYPVSSFQQSLLEPSHPIDHLLATTTNHDVLTNTSPGFNRIDSFAMQEPQNFGGLEPSCSLNREERRSVRILSWIKGKFRGPDRDNESGLGDQCCDDLHSSKMQAGRWPGNPLSFNEAFGTFDVPSVKFSGLHSSRADYPNYPPTSSPVHHYTQDADPFTDQKVCRPLVMSPSCDRTLMPEMTTILEGQENSRPPLVKQNAAKNASKNGRSYQKLLEQRTKKTKEKKDVGPPSEEMIQVRNKIIRNKKEQLCYKVFKSLPFSADSDYPVTPSRDLPYTQGAFREEIERWMKHLQWYNMRYTADTA